MRRSRVRLLVAAPFWADTKRAVSGRGRNGLQNMDCVSGNPSGEKIGGVPERSKGSDCKSDGYAFEGSNPSPTTMICGTGLFRYRKALRERYAGMVQW